MRISRSLLTQYIGKRRRKILWVSLLNAILLTFGGYLWNNQPLYTGEDIEEFSHIQWLWEKFGGKTLDEELDNALFINVSYDKQLVEHRDDTGVAVGITDVTDRKKLLDLLKMAEETNNYRYLILDVRFEEENYCADDSALFQQIGKMDRVVVATHKDITTPQNFPASKAALADYYATITATNFERYEYLHADTAAIPLYVYQELNGKTMKQHFCLTTCDGRLCQKCLFLKFPSVHFDKYSANGDQRYFELGQDILGYYREDFAEMAEDQIIVVGNYVEDLHDTYIGMKPGPYILYRAFLALEHGEHFINWWYQLLFAFVYFIISCMMFMRNPLLRRIPFIRDSKSRLLQFGLTFLGCTMLMTVLDVLLFFQGHIHSILFPSFYFGLMKLIISYRRTKI